MKETIKFNDSFLDTLSYRLSPCTTCKVLNETEGTVTLESKSKIIAELPKSLLQANFLEIIDGHVLLSSGLYEIHFINKPKSDSLKKMNDLFYKNISIIFNHKDLILSKPEYYYLTPDYLVSGAAYIGDFRFCLGALVETFAPEHQIFPSDFEPFKNLYLINLVGSPLSGSFSATFWNPELEKIVCLGSKNGIILPQLFVEYFTEFKNKSFAGFEDYDFQDLGIERLLKEIQT